MLRPGSRAVWQWLRNGETLASIGSHAVDGAVNLTYRIQTAGGGWRECRYAVIVEATLCRYGGSRAWFRCPSEQCGRRVAILYQADDVFACRHCCRLAYSSSRERSGQRALRKAEVIRERLGWKRGLLHPTGHKPKGMHWRTYSRLAVQVNALTQVAIRDMARQLGF